MAKPPGKRQKPAAPSIDAALDRLSQRASGQDGAEDERVRLVQRDGDAHPLLIYATDKGINVELRVDANTFWATQKTMAEMFDVTRENITTHLGNVFREGELDETAVCKESLLTAADGKRYRTKEYNLNAVIAVGYRVSSVQGTMFRVWATDKLFRYLQNGFVVDVERLKNHGAPDALDEFRGIAREIRTSARNSYREVLRLCALCADYDGSSQTARDFFMMMENKLLWAAAGKTAPQLILERADATKADMGLTYYSGKRGPTRTDVLIGNNYLAPGEQATKGRITEMWLTYVEDQLDQGRLPTMHATREKLDGFIKFNGWPLLADRGRHKREDAEAYALDQLELYRERMKADAEAGGPRKVSKPR
jgi:hypothetical protein